MTDIGHKSFISSLINVSSQWVSRLLGIISIIIIARILSPEDYGLVAMAQLSISFLQIILFDGASTYLIRKKTIENDDLNTAWSVRLVLCLLTSTILISSKEYIADYFEDERLIDILLYLSLGNIINGFETIGHILYAKKLDYKKIFFHRITVKLFGFVVTVGVAIQIQNYWALVSGLITMQIVSTISSFYYFEYRPRFSFCKIREQWNFSKWIFLSNFTSFIRNKLDQLLISKFLDAKSLGFFNMTYQLTNMPYTEIVEPVQQVVYASYSSVLQDKKKLANMFIQVVGVISTIIFPIYLGLLAVTEDIVLLVLGENWTYTIELFPIIILLLLSQTISLLATNMLTVLGKVKLLTILNWSMVFLMLPTLLYIIQLKNLELFIWGRVLLAIIFIPIVYCAVFMYLKIDKIKLLFAILRPMLASLVMYYTLNNLVPLFELLPTIPALISKIIFGTNIFIVTQIFIWKVENKSIGGEEFILNKLKYIFNTIL